MKNNPQKLSPIEKQIEKLLRKRLRIKFDEATFVDWIMIDRTGAIDFGKKRPHAMVSCGIDMEKISKEILALCKQ